MQRPRRSLSQLPPQYALLGSTFRRVAPGGGAAQHSRCMLACLHFATLLSLGVSRPRPCIYEQSQLGAPSSGNTSASAAALMPVCIAPHKLCWDARQSFPSGLASISFAMCLHLSQVRLASRVALSRSHTTPSHPLTQVPALPHQVLIAALRQLKRDCRLPCLLQSGSMSAL